MEFFLKYELEYTIHIALQLAFSYKNMSWRSVHVIKVAECSMLRMYINLLNNFSEAGAKIQQPKKRPPEIYLSHLYVYL